MNSNTEHATPPDAGETRWDPIAAVWSPATVRARCAAILRAVEDGRSPWFSLERSRLPGLAERLAAAIHEQRADLLPCGYNPWRAFAAGGTDRATELEQRLADRDALTSARVRIDLAIIVALLDTDAAASWRYDERPGQTTDALGLPAHRQRRDDLLAMLDRASGTVPVAADGLAPPGLPQAAAGQAASPACRLSGSTGLAVATLRAFVDGAFSSDPADALRVDARALGQLDGAALRALLPGGAGSVPPALDARAALLRRLGALLEDAARSDGGPARPARELDPWLSGGTAVDATDLLYRLASRWAPIWFDGGRVLAAPAGDVWPHRWAGAQAAARSTADAAISDDTPTAGWVPLHLPAQRLVHALVEPLRLAGLQMDGLSALTGLADVATCRLLLESGIVVPRDARDLARAWRPGDERTIELRALAVALTDEIARQLRGQLAVNEGQLPLPAVIAACSWLAAEAGDPQATLLIDGHGSVL